jgi:23S rRNA (guanosine2251-2'-O)-methyltransferase
MYNISYTMPKQQVYLILDNIRSAYNVGSIFRTADAAGVGRIYLCGITPVPPHTKIAKTALGAEKYLSWEYHRQTWRLLDKLKKEGIQIIALEQTSGAIDYGKFKPKFPVALIVGNELKGLSKKILSYADRVIEIPMYGSKESLNVSVACGIALYKIIEVANWDSGE